jgi:hypothetical protein
MVGSKRPNLCGFAGGQATIRLRTETLMDKLPRPPLSKDGSIRITLCLQSRYTSLWLGRIAAYFGWPRHRQLFRCQNGAGST